jgi:hypothetical protein
LLSACLTTTRIRLVCVKATAGQQPAGVSRHEGCVGTCDQALARGRVSVCSDWTGRVAVLLDGATPQTPAGQLKVLTPRMVPQSLLVAGGIGVAVAVVVAYQPEAARGAGSCLLPAPDLDTPDFAGSRFTVRRHHRRRFGGHGHGVGCER